VVLRGGSEEDAVKYITELYKHVPVLDSGARGATTTFSQKSLGDVHLTWENEAFFEVEESGGQLEIVYPPISIRAEPRVAIVDSNVDRKKTREAAEAYLQFLYTPEAQEIIAKQHYRPYKPEVLHKYSDSFQPIELFTIQQIASGWDDAQTKFFTDGAVFDQIYASGK
jgi:sulfate transport system substrate-binding protein